MKEIWIFGIIGLIALGTVSAINITTLKEKETIIKDTDQYTLYKIKITYEDADTGDKISEDKEYLIEMKPNNMIQLDGGIVDAIEKYEKKNEK